MSTAPTPEPTELTPSQRRVLDDLAAHENASDPGYVLRMNAPVGREEAPDADPQAAVVGRTVARGRRRDRMVQGAVVGVVVALLLPPAWTLALVLTVALVVGPTYLVVRALREGGLQGPPGRPERPGPPADPERT
ncbi:hypothetical protein [Actinomycetospora termitidis]|uniref:DUF3040 domain-containing protein n=1 Tax=Actinomycetospora termitidis TaxID=3053470 RepID=A0ABT7M3G0_9PSEU|nr:hypothetical protein [Actinomycetospora sp. Odt1-22]MDL5155206.1 hypothetical protein [Actinomycetospora sp. Odt1-22]